MNWGRRSAAPQAGTGVNWERSSVAVPEVNWENWAELGAAPWVNWGAPGRARSGTLG